jgi:hypothetical protein
MADGVNDPQPLVRASDEHAADPPLRTAVGIGRGSSARRALTPHSQKFQAVTATLIGVAIGAVVIALAILAGSGGSTTAAAWSSWSPPDGGSLGAREIADHIAPFYRISSVDQLDVVTVVNLSSSSASAAASSSSSASSSSTASPGLQVAVRADPSTSQVSLLSGNTVAYNLCGIGSSNCMIGVGTPSNDRLLLLRREALELALYSFKYLKGVQNVVAILPPGRPQQTSTLSAKPPTSTASATPAKPVVMALLFVHGELQPWLSQPLSNTFPEQFPPTVPELGLWRQTAEAGLVDQLTARGLFSERLVQAQDGSNLIVLDPLPPQ